MFPLHDVSGHISKQDIESVSLESHTAVLSLVKDLSLSRSVRKPVEEVQLSQQELKHLSIAKCAYVICEYRQVYFIMNP